MAGRIVSPFEFSGGMTEIEAGGKVVDVAVRMNDQYVVNSDKDARRDAHSGAYAALGQAAGRNGGG